MEIMHTLLQIPDTKLHGDFKHIPHTSSNTRCHHISLRHFVYNTNKPKLHESCSTKSKPYSKLQIKTFFVVLLKKSFVIHFCCLKNIVIGKLTISRNAIKLLVFVVFCCCFVLFCLFFCPRARACVKLMQIRLSKQNRVKFPFL